jgi:CDP-4-dehydro-6-deoxyglucose reductase
LLSENVLKLTVKVACDKPFYFLPGQYIDFILDDGEKRAYSIASIPNANSQLELHVRYVPGGRFSELAFNRLDVGATLQIEAPKGRFFWHDERRNPIIMVAGGTGFAPIKAMIEA